MGVNTPARVFIALGSNIAPRTDRLARARALLRQVSAGGWKESLIYETPPVGPEGQEPYFNQVLSFWTTLPALRLLHYLKGCELVLGRQKRGRWESREVDLDLLYWGESIEHKALTLPHPRLHERQFVLIPFCDIDPDWMDPLSARSAQELLEALQAKEGAYRFRVVGERED